MSYHVFKDETISGLADEARRLGEVSGELTPARMKEIFSQVENNPAIPDAEPVAFGSFAGMCDFNGQVLPGISPVVLAEYPYCWIRKDENIEVWDLICGKKPWWHDDGMHCYDDSDERCYRLPFADVATATEWPFHHKSEIYFVVDGLRMVWWSNFDIPEGSATSTEIYFEKTEAIQQETAPTYDPEYRATADRWNGLAEKVQRLAYTSELLTPEQMETLLNERKAVEHNGALQEKTVTPGTEQIIVKSDQGYYGLSEVIVEAVESGGSGSGSTDYVSRQFVQRSLSGQYTNDEVTTIGGRAFFEMHHLESVSFPNVTAIAAKAFTELFNLVSVNFPKCETIGDDTFSLCISLTTISFPKLTSIGGWGFMECKSLKKADFYSLTSLGNYAFSSSGLDTLIIRSAAVATFGTGALNGTPIASGSGYIYVPSALVSSYKSKSGWSTYSARIRAIESYPDITGG